jgi:splicing factor U2AF subunit
LVGNVYVRFRSEDAASTAVQDLNDRFYAGRPIYAELSPVADFREACCRQYETNECTRGGFCNFMHVRRPTLPLERALFTAQRKEVRMREEEERRRRY